MGIELRVPDADDWPAICRSDARSFGSHYTSEQIDMWRPAFDLSRFRIAVDGPNVVGVAGSFPFDATLPGGTTVPMGGVTWVGVTTTHRRQGVMRSVVEAVHDDIDSRGEVLATLFASEGSIYRHLGYAPATSRRAVVIDPRRAALRPELGNDAGRVRYVEGDARAPMILDIVERARRLRPGDVNRDPVGVDIDLASADSSSSTPTHYLGHDDGFAAYTIKQDWNLGQPQHELTVTDFVAVTPEANLALWRTLLNMDLVGSITARNLSTADPLDGWLVDQRELRTVALNDGVWVNVRDVAIAFSHRRYRVEDSLVVEADGQRWQITGGPDGATCRRSRRSADLATDRAHLGALVYGGVRPSSLVIARRMEARSAAVLARADVFFPSDPPPHCNTFY